MEYLSGIELLQELNFRTESFNLDTLKALASSFQGSVLEIGAGTTPRTLPLAVLNPHNLHLAVDPVYPFQSRERDAVKELDRFQQVYKIYSLPANFFYHIGNADVLLANMPFQAIINFFPPPLTSGEWLFKQLDKAIEISPEAYALVLTEITPEYILRINHSDQPPLFNLVKGYAEQSLCPSQITDMKVAEAQEKFGWSMFLEYISSNPFHIENIRVLEINPQRRGEFFR